LAKIVWFLVQEKIGHTLSYPGKGSVRSGGNENWEIWGTKQGICCLCNRGKLEPLVEVLGNMKKRFKNTDAVVGNSIAGWKNRRSWQKNKQRNLYDW
jgi:hypothetical protein